MNGKERSLFILRRILFVSGIVLAVFFGLMLLCNLIIIVKSTIDSDRPPGLFGVMPMVVKSGSMSGDARDHIEVDDLIIVCSIDYKKLEVGDIIAYMSKDKKVVTHRIVSIETDSKNELRFITKGDANNTTDEPIGVDRIIGIYRMRIPKLGKAVMFLQTPLGVVLSVGIPIVAFFTVDLVVHRRRGRKRL